MSEMPSVSPAPLQQPGWRDSMRRAFQRPELGLVFASLLVVIVTGVLDKDHNYWNHPATNAEEVLRQVAMLGIFSLGAAIVIIAGGIDLSSGSVIAFSGTVCATLLLLLAPEEMAGQRPVGWNNIILAIGGTLLAGFLIGSFHAWLITVVRLPPFIATLSTLVGLRSLARVIVEAVTAKKSQIEISDKQFRLLAQDIRIPVLLFVALAGIAWLLMSRTVVGRHLHALGGNEQAARLSGIKTDRLKWVAYCLSALLSSVAGILYIGQESTAAPQTLARGYELNAIASAVVGGCSLQGGVGTIPGTIMGVVFLQVVIDAVQKLIQVNADVYEGLLVGGVVVVAVALMQWRQGGGSRRRFFSGSLGLVTLLAVALLAGGMALIFFVTDLQLRAQVARIALLILLVGAAILGIGFPVRAAFRGKSSSEATRERG